MNRRLAQSRKKLPKCWNYPGQVDFHPKEYPYRINIILFLKTITITIPIFFYNIGVCSFEPTFEYVNEAEKT